ncbi:MAG: OPT/YSL family transporter [Kofleriaceae bacterium]|nr:OPT/YSL family transporter [Kofleriaceae bacterium]
MDRLDEDGWYREAYRRDVAQLTLRAVATGAVLGFVLSFANVYIGLKTGWFFSMALAAALASFATWQVLAAAGFARTPLTILETNCMQSTASSAAYATGNMVVGIVPAMLLLSGTQPSWGALAAWIACVGALGVTLAIPLKRQLINRERLKFPSGTAAAIMLHGLFRRGGELRVRGRLLAGAIGLGALLAVVRDLRGLAVIASSSRVFDWLPRLHASGGVYSASQLGIVLDHSVLLVAAGVFVGLRTSAWMVVGGLITAFAIGPAAVEAGAGTRLDFAWAESGVWAGAPFLVAYAAVALGGQWRAIARALRGRRRDAISKDAAEIEIPAAWFWTGFALCGTAAVVLARVLFGIPIIFGVLAVAMSLVFSTVACRITGETDITPGGPIGKLTQVAFGALRPHHPTTNLVTASLTHASSVAAADLLNDLKSGYLLGADPRKQFVAQALGIVAGTCASVLAYHVLVPDVNALTDGRFAAPAAHQFRAIAELLQDGIASLHPLHQALVIGGAAAGLVFAALERLAPPHVRRFVPSAAGLGLGLLVPVSTSIGMFVGASLAALVARIRGGDTGKRVWPIAAGALAGESLAGVVVAVVNNVTG